jgi:hypothetical protein
MTYRDLLYPWHIVRLLPKAQRITVARFRNRNQADSHARILRQLIPGGTFVILFDPPPVVQKPGFSSISRLS